MERPLFDTDTAVRTGRRAITLPVSLAVHAAVVAGALTLPLLGDSVLPEVSAAPRVFFTGPPTIPVAPPPPSAPSVPVRTTATAAQRVALAAGLVAPVRIPDNVPDEIDVGGGFTGGDPNGVIGGDPTAATPRGIVVGGIPDAPTLAKPIRVSEMRGPRKLRHVAPTYPPLAIQTGIQGTVIVECTIDATGRVVNANVVNGIPLLNDAARDAVLQWVYTPTLLSGMPVPVLLRASVTFSLQH